MSDTLSQQIDYHSVRAAEESERAEAAKVEAGRLSHLELSRLHRSEARSLKMKRGGAPRTLPRPGELDMGEASREQGFRLFGCR